MTQATTLDLTNKREIIQHLRDLLNIGPMLDIDLDKEIFKFLKRVEEAGWSKETISSFKEIACNYTIYEQHLSRPILERGNYLKYTQM